MTKRRARGPQACGKRRFRDHQQAVAALHGVRNNNPQAGYLPIRAYECLSCRGWHLTSAVSDSWQADSWQEGDTESDGDDYFYDGKAPS